MKLKLGTLLTGILIGLVLPYLFGRELKITITHDIARGIRKPVLPQSP